MSEVKTMIRQVAPLKKNIVLSTININWVARSLLSSNFYSSILNSDIVTIDGKPLFLMSKLFGCPVKEIVPGSTLIQNLMEEDTNQPLSIFLFGGENDSAEKAMQQINISKGGLNAVGAINPGFGTVEEMSNDKFIDAINKARPDILLVALGAEKGMEWIEKNRNKLEVGVISHLGATINFIAGTIKRAPKIMSESGLEWLWRIFQEPKLLSRYLLDGIIVFQQLFLRFRFFPDIVSARRKSAKVHHNDSEAWQETSDCITIRIPAFPVVEKGSRLCTLFYNAAISDKHLYIDFFDTRYVDSTFLGLMLILQKVQLKKGKKLLLINTKGRISKILRFYAFEPSRLSIQDKS